MSDDAPRPAFPPCMLPLLTRRRFLERSVATAAMLPLISATACEFTDVETKTADAAVPFDLSDPAFAPLAEVGGWAVADATALKILLIRDSEDKIMAFTHLCPHQGKPLAGGDTGTTREEKKFAWSQAGLVCFWHGASFGPEGESKFWPPQGNEQTDIQMFDVSFDKASGQGTIQVLNPKPVKTLDDTTPPGVPS